MDNDGIWLRTKVAAAWAVIAALAHCDREYILGKLLELQKNSVNTGGNRVILMDSNVQSK